MNNDVMFSSKTDNWATPMEFFKKVDEEFHFTLDVYATKENAKYEIYYNKEDNGLSKEWYGTVWCNPPYGRTIGKWVEKARKSYLSGATVVMLLPARTDTRWFHDYIYHVADEIRFIKGRLKFGNSKISAPFPSMLVIFRGEKNERRI